MEAPSCLGISDDYFRKYVASELRWIRRGRKKLVAIAELERWLEANAALTLETREPDLGRAQSSRDERRAKATAQT